MNYLWIFILLPFTVFSQSPTDTTSDDKSKRYILKDSLIIVSKNEQKGFYHDYILFIPKATKKNKPLYLVVEPNNTGKTSDSIEVHKEHAIALASVSSVGNNIATNLRIPILVPIFPRPDAKPLLYTHALDRDALLETDKNLKRLDLQLISMIKDAKEQLKARDVLVEDKVFMNGFSASGSFTNRFLFLHPTVVKAAAMGGLNGELMLPMKKFQNKAFDYPLGINNLKKFTGTEFNKEAYLQVPQLIYMGELDDNDAVQFDDAYSEEERKLINTHLGKTVPERWKKVQEIYNQQLTNITFKTYPNVGHFTTSEMNIEVIKYFQQFLNK